MLALFGSAGPAAVDLLLVWNVSRVNGPHGIFQNLLLFFCCWWNVSRVNGPHGIFAGVGKFGKGLAAWVTIFLVVQRACC